jgi:hypothetical protein
LEYLRGGCEISISFGVDYTASNGSPSSSSSLHYLGSKMNPYQKALVSVGNIVAHYDADQTFPVYGYGAYVNGKFPRFFNANLEEDVQFCFDFSENFLA